MADLIEKETEKAWEELVGKKKEKKEEKKEINEEKEEETAKGEEEKAAVWLTGGLEDEVSGGGMTAPVLQSNPVPVESLEDFASSIPKKKEEEKEEKPYDARMYETRGEYDSRKEIYEETAENLFGRFVKPLDTNELRQDFPRVRMPTPTEFLNKENEREEMIKYVDKKPAALESQGLSFLQHEKRLDIRKYKKG
jgi:hypothetical protein